MSSPVFDVSKVPYSATGNGSTNDYAAVQAAINDAQAVNGCVYFPTGVYLVQTTLSFQSPNNPSQRKISFKGDGPNISVIKAGNGAGGLDLTFAQSGSLQPWGST